MQKVAKRVLTRSGIQYFDAGGNVLPPQNTQFGHDAASGFNNSFGGFAPLSNPSSSVNPGNYGQGINQIGQGLGSGLTGLASDFTAQNGYQAQLAPVTELNYQPVINPAAANALSGQNQFNQNLGTQQGLQQALIAQSQGQGPNPALATLNNQTGQNVANTAALIGSQRGASANPALLARQAALQGANIQQQGIGQAAAQQAAQELAASGQAATLGGQLGGQITAQQNANTGLFSQAAGANTAQNNTNVNNYGQAQGINAQTAQSNANAVNKTLGGGLGAIGSLFSMARGGVVPSHLKAVADIYHPQKMADGGVTVQIPNFATQPDSGKSDKNSSPLSGVMDLIPLALAALKSGGQVPGKPKVNHNSYSNDTVPALLTPKEIVLPLSVTQAENPPEAARAFVAKLQGKEGGKGDANDFKIALKKAMMKRSGNVSANAK